ncbi:MAG TPA: AtpZ/AtpI family protein [Bacteroidota bacterium]|nr:AtpZ/AtpI family protein [Bacteroidota bacterium]
MAEPEDGGRPSKDGEPENVLRQVSPYIGLGLQLALTVAIFYFIGSWMDDRFQTAPYLMVVGSMVGIVGGFIKFYKTVTALSEKGDKEASGRR